jgi:hypothetical protein
MAQSFSTWINRRRAFGHEVASVLYGVIALMSADLVYRPGMITRYAAAGGAVLVGLAMALTHAFVQMVESETERSSHVSRRETMELVRSSMFVMAFPTAIAILAVVGQFLDLQIGVLDECLPFISAATVLVVGFGSSYAITRQWAPALKRGISWMLLGLILLVAKEIASYRLAG